MEPRPRPRTAVTVITIVTAMLAALGASVAAQAAPAVPAQRALHIASPNGRIDMAVSLEPRLAYDVRFDGKPLINGATFALDVDGKRLGAEAALADARFRHVEQKIQPPVRQQAAVLNDNFNELRLECAGGYAVTFRAYDQGVAYRFETSLGDKPVKVRAEEASFPFAADAPVYYPLEESFFSHNEPSWKHPRLGEITPAMLASIPALVETAAGPRVAIAESDVEDYPGLWLRGSGGTTLTATFPPYPLKEKRLRDRDIKVETAADYIAQTRGNRTFPWRILGIAERDGDLLVNPLVYLLARPSQIADTSWIKPGKVAWDWWNALNLKGVDFQPGVNTRTYKFYIDFASKYGIEYIVLDEGWYKPGNLLKQVPEIDVPELVRYGREKKVGIILWAVWKTLDDQFEPAIALFEKWGVKGLKIDFMQRDDQPVMNFYTRMCRELAKRKMLADFHGGVRAILMTRTWPNLLTTEGVKGLEHVKWSKDTEPEHDTTLPFTRMFLGPMDFTPGAMINATKDKFRIVFKEPMSMGTRAHQLAMYVVYESPLQMLADAPTNYMKEPDAMEFLGPVPTVWDETRVLDGRIADYVVVARRKGADWWVGAMTDWTPRELDLDLGFMFAGAAAGSAAGKKLQMTAFEDGPAAADNASDYRKTVITLERTTHLKVKLAPGGGWAAHVHP